jgi:hypothetical protein
MNLYRLPPLSLAVGLEFAPGAIVVEDPTAEVPRIDLTGWTGEVVIAAMPREASARTGEPWPLDAVFYRAPVTISATSEVIILILPEETQALRAQALPIIGGRPEALLQITLTSPVLNNSIVAQGPLTIAGVYA